MRVIKPNGISAIDLKNHPASDIFPMMSDDEIVELAADIKANGLLNPIIVQDGLLIDGRNRRMACLALGIEPQIQELPHGIDPLAVILSANINRRHLTKGQRAMAVAKLYPESQHGGPRAKGQKASVSNTVVSAEYIQHARTVLRWLPEIADLVMAGTKPLNEAYAEAQRIKEQADAEPKRLERLRVRAPELAEMVDEGRMTLLVAESAYNTKLGEQRRERQAVLDMLDGVERLLDVFTDGPRRVHTVKMLRDAPDDQRRLHELLAQWIKNLTEMEALL